MTDLVINFGIRTAGTVTLKLVERLGTDDIFACVFCDAHVNSLPKQLRVVELTYCTAVHIIKSPPKRSANLAPISSDQEFIAPSAMHEGKSASLKR